MSYWRVLAVCCLVGHGSAQTASASSFLWTEVPGALHLLPTFALPALVLTAIIKRPFLTWAGVPRRRALGVSFRASTVGFVALIATLPVSAILSGPLCGFTGMLLAVWFEVRYLRRTVPEFQSGGFVFTGQLAAAITTSVLPYVAIVLKRSDWRWAVAAREIEQPLAAAAAGVCVAVFAMAWVVKGLSGDEATATFANSVANH